jgi:hypothetical protein
MSTPAPASTDWVPVWNLDGAVDLRYDGSYVGGTAYKDGEIVVQNGIAYLCVRPTSNPPAAWPMSPGISAYGTSLPASPYDGQMAILVNSVTTPNYQWQFRYNAQSTSAYKWEFVGGAPWGSYLTGGSGMTTISPASTWVNIPPTLTVPRAGDYLVRAKADIERTGGTATNNIYFGPNQPQTVAIVRVPAGYITPVDCQMRWDGITAGAVIQPAAYCDLSAGANAYDGSIFITPIRIS